MCGSLSYVVFEPGDLASSPLYSPVFWHLLPAWLPALSRSPEGRLWLETSSSFESGCKSLATTVGLDRRPGRAIGRLRTLCDGRHGGGRVCLGRMRGWCFGRVSQARRYSGFRNRDGARSVSRLRMLELCDSGGGDKDRWVLDLIPARDAGGSRHSRE